MASAFASLSAPSKCSSSSAAAAAHWRAPALSRAHPATAASHRAVTVRVSASGNGTTYSSPLRPGETADQAAARRAKESARVEERTKYVTSRAELDAAFALLPDDALTILSIESDSECDLGSSPGGSKAPTWATPEDKATRMAECLTLKDSLQRISRECSNVEFVTLEGDVTQEARLLAQELGAKTFPTVQFWKNGRLLWQYAGASAANAQLGEGVLFWADGRATDYVAEVTNDSTFDAFLQSCAAPQTAVRGITLEAPCEQQLAVLDVSLAANSPGCVHVFPAVLALAKNTAGAIRWGRLLGDASPDAAALMKKLNVTSVPTFIMMHNGKEVGRYVGADRGQLMAAVLDATAVTGLKLPEPPARKRPSVAEAKRIAAEARERDKAMGRKSGW